MPDESSLSGEEIEKLVSSKLEKYEELNALEQYAMFMGKAQILEFGLKKLLARKYDISPKTMENWTMGKVKNELENNGLRSDFITYLDSVVDHRNHIAHEFLLTNSITRLIADFSDRKLYGDLFRAIYELEQIIILFDWTEENEGW